MTLIRQRKSTAVRREEIAKAALYVIAQSGVKSLTTAALAKEVGVTSGALFRHFTTLDEMLLETVQYALARIEQTFPDPTLPPVDRLTQLASNRIQLIGSQPGLSWILRSNEAYHVLPAEGVALLEDMVRRSRRFLLLAIREGASQGIIRSDIKAEVLLVIVTGTIQALIGIPGPAGRAAKSQNQSPESVMSALISVIEPPHQKP